MSAPIRLAVAAVFALAPSAALADPTPEQAHALQQQLRGWIEQVTGSNTKIPDRLFQVAPEGDHYRVSFALGALPGIAVAQGGDMVASAHPLTAGRWVLYDYRFATPFRFRLDVPPMANGHAGLEDLGPLDVAMNFGRVDADAVLDPGFATPSVVTARIAGYEVESRSRLARQNTRFDTLGGEISIIPAANGRIDVTQEGTGEDFSSTTKAGGRDSLALAIRRVHAVGQISGLDRDRALPVIRGLFQLGTTALATIPSRTGEHGPAPGNEAHSPAPQFDRRSLRDLYLAVRGIAAGGELTDTLEDVRIATLGHIVGLGRLSIGAGVGTPNGTLNTHVSLAMDGITSPDIPAAAADYVPRHVLVQPSISGIDLADLDALIMAATAPEPAPAEIASRAGALFAHGGVTAGLDSLELDLGPTHIGATGKITALAPDHYKGEAEVTATGFAALVDKAKSMPDLAKVAPFLQLLGTLGRADGERTVWKISSDNADVKVNGLDLTTLFSGGKEPGKQNP